MSTFHHFIQLKVTLSLIDGAIGEDSGSSQSLFITVQKFMMLHVTERERVISIIGPVQTVSASWIPNNRTKHSLNHHISEVRSARCEKLLP